MFHIAEPFPAEASTADMIRSCFGTLQECIQNLQDKDRIYIQTRLADLRLWADSVGAVAQAKASLDWRFRHRPDDIKFIQGLLSMLEVLLNELLTAARNGTGIRDAMINIDSMVNSLAFVGVQIRQSGRKSRLRKADDSFERQRERYYDLRAHLACLIASKPTMEGRPKNEGKEFHSVDYFANLKLSPIQERLVEANLRRRHRFIEAQRHSYEMQGYSTDASYTIIPSQFVTMAANRTVQNASPMQDTKIAAALQPKQTDSHPDESATDTMAPTSASGLDSTWTGFQNNRLAKSTITRITAITATTKYPRVRKSLDEHQALVKCPCCCQAIPASDLEDSQWRKHVANDLCPYTCILEDCPKPHNLYVTQKEWNDHVMNDHPPHWQCPCCEDNPPTFKSLSRITTHMMSEHAGSVSDGLEELLSIAEINVMGIKSCPLCDSEGPQDSPDLVEHVFHHIHSFSLYSLPWPTDPETRLDKPVGTFDMAHAEKIIKDDKGARHVFRIDDWAESVGPKFDEERGVNFVHNDKGEELFLNLPGSLKSRMPESDLKLQLCSSDLDSHKPSEEAFETRNHPVGDYFAYNDYFNDGTDTGDFTSQLSDNSQQTQNGYRPDEKQFAKRWICTLCSLSSIEGSDAFFQHLDDDHVDSLQEAVESASRSAEQWKQSMLDEAYRNGIDAISISASHTASPRVRPSSPMTGASGWRAGSVSVDKNAKFEDNGNAGNDSSIGRLEDIKAVSQHGSVSDDQADNTFDNMALSGIVSRYRTMLTRLRQDHGTADDMDLEDDAEAGLATMCSSEGEALRRPQGMKDVGNLGKDIEIARYTIDVTPGDHPDLRRRLKNIGKMLFRQYEQTNDIRHLNEAIAFKRKAIEITPQDHSDVVEMWSDLAIKLDHLYELTSRESDASEAILVLKKAVEVCTEALGPHNQNTLSSMVNLAYLYVRCGRLVEAEQLQTQLLETRRDLDGEKDHDTLLLMHHLAIAYRNKGRLHKALHLMGQALEIFKQVLGEEHPNTLQIKWDLAVLNRDLRQSDSGIQAMREVIGSKRNLLGVDHPTTLHLMYSLAISYHYIGRLIEATEVLEQVAEGMHRVVGADWPDRLRSIHTLEMFFDEIDRLREAKKLVE